MVQWEYCDMVWESWTPQKEPFGSDVIGYTIRYWGDEQRNEYFVEPGTTMQDYLPNFAKATYPLGWMEQADTFPRALFNRFIREQVARLGNEGWEVVSVDYRNEAFSDSTPYRCCFKRPKK